MNAQYRQRALARCAAVWIVLLSATLASAAPMFSDLLVFGDSLSDVGNDFAFTFGQAPGGPGYYDGRFSNGPVWVERLGVGLGLGAPTNSRGGGKDYAYGGVTTGGGTTELNPGGFVSRPAPNIGKQITDWTAANTATGTQLFTLLGGGNDFFADLDSGANNTPASVATNMKNNIQALYDDSARNFIVVNLPDLGVTPRYRGGAKAAQATMLSTDYNADLKTALDQLQSADPGIHLYRLDLFKLVNDVIAKPADFGLQNVTDRAYTGDDTYAGNGTAVADPSKYLFWDSVHPTTAGQTLIGNAALALAPEPGGSSVIAIMGVFATARRPRRRAAQRSAP